MSQIHISDLNISIDPIIENSGVQNQRTSHDKNRDILEQVESKRFIEEEISRTARYIPNIDFREPENFVKYGSAEKYYSDSIERIYKRYPYDGSKKEVLEWYNDSSYLDLYIFENLYPRNIGYISLNSWMTPGVTPDPNNYQSINFSGYPNADDTYINPYHIIEAEDSQANIIDDKRGANAKYISNKGMCIEYWAKVDSKDTIETLAEGVAPIDQDYDTPVAVSNLYSKGRSEASEVNNIIFTSGFNCRTSNNGLTFEHTWYLSFDISKYTEPTSPETAYEPNSYFNPDQNANLIVEISSPQDWNHIAVSVDQDMTRIYLNGKLVKGLLYQTAIPDIAVLHGNIGSNLSPNDAGTTDEGEFSISGPTGFSIDEFRLWNSTRREYQIKRYWWDQVGGGTNTDDSNLDLGIYYKFNEGIYGSSVYDENVLDYSGRQTDATILNYNASTVRHIDSSPLTSEFRDPVIYPDHSDITSLLEKYQAIGRYYDQKNNSKLYSMIPSWIAEEDQENKSEVLKNMTQIMSSYLDTLYLQIEKLPEVVGSKQEYLYDTEAAENTAKNMLASKGFLVPELFADSTLLEKFEHRNEEEKFQKELSVVKNLIYKNIHNNSSMILKSKGTEKSLRNVFRCFGIDEELLKIRVYPINQSIELDKPRAYGSSIKKRYADFYSTEENRTATVFSYGIGTSSYGVITGSDSVDDLDMSSTTFEVEAFFPKKYTFDGRDLSFANVLTSSIAGVSSVYSGSAGPEDTTQDLNETGNYKIRFIKDSEDSTTGRFSLLFPSGTIGEIFSPTFDVYDNQRWNLSVRIGEKTKYADFMTGSVQDYQVSFSGYNYDSTDLTNSFIKEEDIPTDEAVQTLTVSRRVFAGADLNNHTGSAAQHLSDTMVSSVRYWIDWLPDEVLKSHALYPGSFGTEAIDNSYYYDSGLSGDTIAGKQINKMDLLALNWDFSKIEYRDLINAAGYYSYDRSNSEPTGVNIIDEKIAKNYSARFHYPAGGDTSIKSIAKVKQILGARESEVDYIRDSELISIKESDVDAFKINPDPVYNKVTIEKSYSAVINDEILKYFTGMSYFSNLIGRQVNRYRVNYKELDFFKRKIFSLFNPEGDTTKEPDIEKFLEYYKWIDESINAFMKQMLPASSMDNQSALNIIESHLLERSKYQHKFPVSDNLKPREVGDLEATARFSYERADIINPDAIPAPKAVYYQFVDKHGNKKVLFQYAEVEYRVGSETATPQTDSAENLAAAIREGISDIYLDFSI